MAGFLKVSLELVMPVKITYSYPVPTFSSLPMSAPLGRVHRVVDEGQNYIRTAITTERISSFGKHPGAVANVPDTPANGLTDVATGLLGLYVDNGVLKDGESQPISLGTPALSAVVTNTEDRFLLTGLEENDLVLESWATREALWRFLGGEADDPVNWKPIGPILLKLNGDFTVTGQTVPQLVSDWEVDVPAGQRWAFEGCFRIGRGGGGAVFNIGGVDGPSTMVVLAGVGSGYVPTTTQAEPARQFLGDVYDMTMNAYPIIGPTGGNGDIYPAHFYGSITNGVGLISILFAQASSDAIGDSLLAGSWVRLWPTEG